MPKRMAAGRLHETRFTHRSLHCALNGLFMPMMAYRLTGVRVLAKRIRRKNILPAPLRRVSGVFTRQGGGQRNSGLAELSLLLKENAQL